SQKKIIFVYKYCFLVHILIFGYSFCSFRILVDKIKKSVAIKTVFFESPPKVGFQKKTVLVFPAPKALETPKLFS
ncbi:MAG: hypothetical protein ACK5SD_14400, partial [Pseudanabaena sp.]